MAATVGQLADLQANIDWAKGLMAEFKQQNIDDGINALQALWLHQRIKGWSCTVSGVTFTIDLLNMVVAGDIQTACIALEYGAADDMSQPYHWLNTDRINWLISEMKSFLGWS